MNGYVTGCRKSHSLLKSIPNIQVALWDNLLPASLENWWSPQCTPFQRMRSFNEILHLLDKQHSKYSKQHNWYNSKINFRDFVFTYPIPTSRQCIVDLIDKYIDHAIILQYEVHVCVSIHTHVVVKYLHGDMSRICNKCTSHITIQINVDNTVSY